MADLRDKRVDLILQQLEELPTLPAVAARVLAVTSDGDSSAADVVRLIESDPALSARILQLTRRSDRGVRDDATTVGRAVVLLGFDAVRNAVLAVSVFQALGPSDGGGGAGDRGGAGHGNGPAGGNRRVGREELWKHCLAVACCAELLAEQLPGGGHGGGGATPSDAFLCGLLHDLGKIALDVALPKSYARVVEAADLLRGDIADLERTVIGVDHQVAGKRLAERWQLPPAVRDAAWLHNTAPEALPAGVRAGVVNLVTLADYVVRRQHLGYSGNHAFPVGRDALLAATGLSAAAVDKAAAELVDRMKPRLSALGIGDQSGDDLYRQAIARADQELRRVAGQLGRAGGRRPADTPRA
ncbi:MAG: putative two-component system sensor histidine kinase, partial [Phycisphaerales bacterium]|nr:putative two-component system sensor histidine kinase [Phycisphaerales bacterium]